MEGGERPEGRPRTVRGLASATSSARAPRGLEPSKAAGVTTSPPIEPPRILAGKVAGKGRAPRGGPPPP